MPNPNVTKPSEQDNALVRAIEAMGTIEQTGWFERVLARLLLAARNFVQLSREARHLLLIVFRSDHSDVMLWN